MTSNCKPGDIAILTHDVPSCATNIGRLVLVRGPKAINEIGQLTWLITPLGDEPYMVNDANGEFEEFMPFGMNNLEHPDDWMRPATQEATESADSTDIVEVTH